ncbi:DUF554 domain-containing protein [Enterococcus raffinosus]|uniref:DUF554 domain-containing protein n=1 Tax=Enterococcus raffinosus TaxID=71452 RepID=UPI001C43B665|nr:DUF554 domain-containing protein [Enterococcus raffinosus]MDT2572601.1 DUF554 domain-containing protein [Enterococcus raffinosus]QXJ60140.1 DUF554 domain-containing protein [Enterococcus raffinosus]
MPIGIIINSLSIIIGGLLGGFLGHLLSEDFKVQITLIFGVCSMAMGIPSISQMANMPAVILAIILGTSLGLLLNFNQKINAAATLMQKPIAKFPQQELKLSYDDYMSTLVTIVVLFCASGTGIFGSLTEGMTGDHTILIAKSILDFFTAAIFACNIGYVVSVIAIPQFLIFFSLFLVATVVFPLTTPAMILDFKACGGFLMLATGFRMIKVKMFPTADMIPAMLLVMPISWIWTTWILPLLG